jgi:hypothetical protein
MTSNIDNNNDTNLSEYETKRAENIERNNKRLKELGLISEIEEQRSNDAAWGRSSSSSTTTTRKAQNTTSKKRKKGRNEDDVSNSNNPVRKSARLLGISSICEDTTTTTTTVSLSPSKQQQSDNDLHRKAIVEECRRARQRAAIRVMEAGAEKAAKENPTATYEHCLMRVRTMTHKGLCNRVRTIERAAGKHCVVKMAIFKSCLQDEGLWDIADVASEALERLKGLEAPPEEE